MESNFSERNPRQEWDMETERVNNITDQLGLHIDEGIKDTVVILNLLGINTTSSHEGKIDRYPIPYIDIFSKETENMENLLRAKLADLMSPEEIAVRKETDKLFDQLASVEERSLEAKELEAEIQSLDVKLNSFEINNSEETQNLLKEIEAKNLKVREILISLLNQFYIDRNTADNFKLEIIDQAHGCSRLQSKGANQQENEMDNDVKISNLKHFQKEMLDFTEFLKRQFFNNTL